MDLFEKCLEVYSAGEYRQAESLTSKLISHSLQNQQCPPLVLARFLTLLGSAQLRCQSYHSCVASYQSAEQIIREAYGPTSPFLSTIYINMGIAYMAQSDPVKAVTYAQRAKNIVDKDLSGKSSAVLQGSIYHLMGYAADMQVDNKTAKDYYERAVKLRRSTDPYNDAYGKSSYNLGSLLLSMRMIEPAEQHLKAALQVYQHLVQKKPTLYGLTQARVLYRLALLYKESNRQSLGAKAAEAALEQFKLVKDPKNTECLNASALLNYFRYGSSRGVSIEESSSLALDWL